jgi:predicted dehydrogenase
VKLSAAVIGLGQIGMGYDFESGDAECALTHCSAFSQHQGFNLIAGVDPRPEARAGFKKKYSKPAFSNMREMFAAASPEVLAIGVPSDLHLESVTEALGHPVRAILCEKPLATTLQDAMEIAGKVKAHGCTFLVNYPRRFDAAVSEIKHRLTTKDIGDVYKAVLWYSKGLLNNGSHFIDMLSFLFGPCTGVRILQKGRRLDNGDPEPDILLHFGDLAAYMLAGREENFSCGSLELIGNGGTIHYPLGDFPSRIYRTKPDPLFPNYFLLSREAELINPDVRRYMYRVVDAFYDAIVNKRQPASNIATAIETMQVVNRIMQMTNEVNDG